LVNFQTIDSLFLGKTKNCVVTFCVVMIFMKKLTINDMQALAQKHGGRCLSKNYINNRIKLRWECKHGHKWEAVPDSIKNRGSWCPICGVKKRAEKKRLAIDKMQKIAGKRGGKCLSDKYIDIDNKLKWECAKGHIWEATPNNVKNNKSWCQKCAGLEKLTIQEMHQLAESHRGKCLSKTYVNNKTKLKWECQYGHQWEAIPNSIKNGKWCPVCGYKKGANKKKLSIKEMQKIAKERGGRCLSTDYQDAHTYLKWECSQGHQWEAKPYNVKNGSWCKICGQKATANKLKLGIEEMRRIAEERGGKCLSTRYVNANSKLLWECKFGHRWKARGNHIKRGGWCRECSTGLGERICRIFFEQIFKKPFPRVYPEWLVTEDGNRMELDGFCKELKIAFEHQGIHHYAVNNLSMKTKKALIKRRSLDKLKKALCESKGVILIQIPEIPTKINANDVKKIIKRKSGIYNFELPDNFDDLKIDYNEAYITPHLIRKIEQMHQIAKERGGKCLSKHYTNKSTKLLWECSKGHQWEAIPHNVIRGSWCPKCSAKKRAAKRKLSIDEFHDIAKSRGGKCLSLKYINIDTKLKWECIKGHQWMATPYNVKRGKWCPKCGREKSIKKRETFRG
jgi:hypothetical protein